MAGWRLAIVLFSRMGGEGLAARHRTGGECTVFLGGGQQTPPFQKSITPPQHKVFQIRDYKVLERAILHDPLEACALSAAFGEGRFHGVGILTALGRNCTLANHHIEAIE